MGFVCYCQKSYVEAIDWFNKALESSEQKKTTSLTCEILLNLVMAYTEMDDMKQAYAHLVQTDALQKNCNNIIRVKLRMQWAKVYSKMRGMLIARLFIDLALTICVPDTKSNLQLILLHLQTKYLNANLNFSSAATIGTSKWRICYDCKLIDTNQVILTCNRCKRAYYCSVKCQSKAWEQTHKNKCVPSCEVCGVANAKGDCLGCNKVVYCGKECQTIDWPEHQKVCDFSFQ
jgi:tetratricopeptide (TPR) repeat protein